MFSAVCTCVKFCDRVHFSEYYSQQDCDTPLKHDILRCVHDLEVPTMQKFVTQSSSLSPERPRLVFEIKLYHAGQCSPFHFKPHHSRRDDPM